MTPLAAQASAVDAPIIGDVPFPIQWTVFAPLERHNPLPDVRDLNRVPPELRIGARVLPGQTVMPRQGQYDFRSFLGDPPTGFHRVAYVFVALPAPTDTDVSVGLGWDYLLDAWINGKALLNTPEAVDAASPISVCNLRLTLPLKRGQNTLVFRLVGGYGDVILALAGPHALRAGDFRRIQDDPARIDPAWNDAAVEARPGGKPVVEIGDRREGFIDDFLVDRLAGSATRRLHHPEPREIVMTFGDDGMPWEGNAAYPTLLRDGDRIRMYYSARPDAVPDESREQYTCLAESADGIHFTRPELDVFPYRGTSRTNIVFQGTPSHNFTPFIDNNPDAPEAQRYKAIAYHPEGGGLGAFASPDGIHWRLMTPERILTDGAFDSQNLAFWDPLRAHYVAYYRGFRGALPGHRFGGIRDIMTCTSTDFIHWRPARLIEYADWRRDHMYTNAIQPYARAPHLYLGTPARFMPTRRKIPDHPHAGISDAVLISSRDGVHFNRWNAGFIRPSTDPENWTDRNQYPALGLLELAPGELSIYWSEHNKHPDKRLRRGVLRVDGFASLHGSAGQVGELLTRPLIFSGRFLEINYATSAAGTLQFALCDEAGKAFGGFSLEDSEALYGNETAHLVTWRGTTVDLSDFAGRPVRLRVRLQDADLFALRFVQGAQSSA